MKLRERTDAWKVRKPSLVFFFQRKSRMRSSIINLQAGSITKGNFEAGFIEETIEDLSSPSSNSFTHLWRLYIFPPLSLSFIFFKRDFPYGRESFKTI